MIRAGYLLMASYGMYLNFLIFKAEHYSQVGTVRHISLLSPLQPTTYPLCIKGCNEIEGFIYLCDSAYSGAFQRLIKSIQINLFDSI